MRYKPSKILITVYFLPKWRNFSQSGNTGGDDDDDDGVIHREREIRMQKEVQR